MIRTAFLILVLVFAVAALAAVPGKCYWRGMVDDRVQLTLHADKLESRTVSGKEYPEGIFSFTAPLSQEQATVEVRIVKGRGSVKVVQQPAEDNDFTAIVEIADEKGGAKEYQIEISWN
jgi:hypothetical protein